MVPCSFEFPYSLVQIGNAVDEGSHDFVPDLDSIPSHPDLDGIHGSCFYCSSRLVRLVHGWVDHEVLGSSRC